MYINLRGKYPLFLPDFNGLEFSCQIFEKYSVLNVMKVRSLEAGLFRADEQTDG
jgi:hypothetical protein